MAIHIYPINDNKEHDVDNIKCHCNPIISDQNGEMMVIHNSYDGREYKEFEHLEAYGKDTRVKYIGDDLAKSSHIWWFYKNFSSEDYQAMTLDYLLDRRSEWSGRLGKIDIEFDDSVCYRELAGIDFLLLLLSKNELYK